MDRQKDGWIERWLDRRMDGWMHAWTKMDGWKEKKDRYKDGKTER